MAATHPPEWLAGQAQRSLARLLPRIEPLVPAQHRATFVRRLWEQFPRLFALLHTLYGTRYDFFWHLEQVLVVAAQAFAERADDLHALDAAREDDRTWFAREHMVGATGYVDLFAGDFAGLHDRLGYLGELGVTYLHLMPLFQAPEVNSDGGYAVSSYRHTDSRLGTMDDLRTLAAALRGQGISLALDFIFNHTSDEHVWARRARAGDERYREFYLFFADRTLPDQYERTLREIFPEQAPGSFTYLPDQNAWVWTTFYNFQWDLNYANPDVFCAMLGEMLFLANVGVEVLRLDAVAFIWKRMGTASENLPEAHMIIQALNAITRVVSPAMLFKSEAIVHPDDVASFIGWEECPISYNPTLMAMLWDALATRRADILADAMRRRFPLPPDAAWVNYVRVHDDIGWSFADEDMARFGVNGYDHRQFLNQFYTGRFPGSFARGVPFNYNPVTQDMRISGTAASLAGVEQALDLEDEGRLEDSLRRVLMLYGVVMAARGIPLLYLGDELATLNDYSYRAVPGKADDSRWAHRVPFNPERAAQRHAVATPAGQLFQGLARMAQVRAAMPAFGDTPTVFFDTGNVHVLGLVRGGQVLCLFNMTEAAQTVARDVVSARWRVPTHIVEQLSGTTLELDNALLLPAYGCWWLAAAD